MAKLILVGNWKSNPASLGEAKKLLAGLGKMAPLFKKLSTSIAPPAPYLALAAEKAGRIGTLASQDIFPYAGGAHTGSVTTDILKSFGVRLAIIGHSERRALGESDADAAERVRTALKAGITPLLCVGEEAHDAEGNYFELLRRQMGTSLSGVKKSETGKLMLAYEPVWAVGEKAKGAMEPRELAQMVIFIKKVLTELFGRSSADKIPVLYGGSVDAGNAGALVRESGAQGLLVGRASLDPKSFAGIAEALTKR